MKTPLTITVIAWNYCNNHCPYCVSESNKKEWDFNGNFEIWKPVGDESLNYYQLCEKYGIDYHKRMCPDKKRYLHAKDVLDFDAAIKWIKKYKPDAHVHISGGEPLLRPDIEEQVAKVSKEFVTTIVTNGQLISTRPKLLDMPLKWLISYHKGQTPLYSFVQQIRLIKDKPHIISTVMTKEMEEDNWLPPEEFSEYNFEFRYDKCACRLKDFKYKKEDINVIASNTLMLIQPNGPVIPCNKHHYGDYERYKSANNIYTMAFDEFEFENRNARASKCVLNNNCAAYQTAVRMAALPSC